MKYIRTYESYKSSRKDNVVNEELLGGVINFFKGLWSKATEELKKLGENPKQEQVTEWIGKNILNPADDSYIFKQQLDEFKKRPQANDQDCLNLVDALLNPETGALGKQGLQPMLDTLNKEYPPKKGEPMHWLPADTQYVLEAIRNKAIAQYKFAGGPADGKVDPKNINIDLKDTNHLPDVKKILSNAKDDKAKREAIINWIEKTLVPQLAKFEQSITGDELSKNLQAKKITFVGGGASGDYKVGDSVIYKRDKFDQTKWDALTDDDKKKPEEGKMKELQDGEMIGVKKISAISGDEISFEDADFKKKKDDILMKIEVNQNEEAKKAAESLGKIKTDPDKMKTVADLADILQDETKTDQVEQIKKIISGEA